MNLEAIRPVFQGVAHIHGAVGQLAGLARGDEPGAEALDERGGEDEAARKWANELDALAASAEFNRIWY